MDVATVKKHNNRRDQVYSYREAAELIGVRADLISEAVRHGDLTAYTLPAFGTGSMKYIPKYEVEPLVGSGQATSKWARQKVIDARNEYYRKMLDNASIHELDKHGRYSESLAAGEPTPDPMSVLKAFVQQQNRQQSELDEIKSMMVALVQWFKIDVTLLPPSGSHSQ